MRDENNKSPDHSRIVIATPIITKTGGYIPPFDAEIDSPREAAEKTKQLLKKDPDVVKIAIEDSLQGKTWNMLTTEEVRSITDTAHEANLWVAVHISHTRNLPVAINGGVDELSHMVVEPLTDDLVSQIAAKGMYWVPTLELWNEVSKTYGLEWDKTAIQNLSMFYKAEGKIALGTDFGGYFTPFEPDMPIKEMNLMKEAGMTNMDILLAATKNASVVCGMQDRIGTLEPGKIANIIVINGDPLTKLEVLTDLKMVIHNGNIVTR
jgi:imidazolonepropionase-like amidohydrolase